MAGKAKFDQEAAFKSIIGAGATEDEKKADKPAGKGPSEIWLLFP